MRVPRLSFCARRQSKFSNCDRGEDRRFKGKVAIVTVAAWGIGKAVPLFTNLRSELYEHSFPEECCAQGAEGYLQQ